MQTILERRYADQIESDVSDMVWAVFGKAVHGVLEKAQEIDSQLKENKMVIDIRDGYKLSGIFDLYDEKTKTVTEVIASRVEFLGKKQEKQETMGDYANGFDTGTELDINSDDLPF